ncbi:dimethylaniline monooxygenase [Clavulina sp. PMI_390]|nr:dimethylaniline monooxygenase [Clavulina sp. PMI_390]
MTSETAPTDIVSTLLSSLQIAFTTQDVSSVQSLLLPNGYLRDLLVSHWDFASVHRDDLTTFWAKHGLPKVTNLAVSKTRTPPMLVEAVQWIQAYYTFETPVGHGEGFLRLLKDPDAPPIKIEWKILTFSLTLASIKEHPERVATYRPIGVQHGPQLAPKTWLHNRIEESAFPDNYPQVVIIGAGQGGLMVAAHLKSLGVRTLIIEKTKRVGDGWRNRYESLVLHDYVWSNHFPFCKFPESWPVFTPKDKLADWMEAYASIMELNIWLGSTVEPDSATYDDTNATFSLRVRREDGTVRTLTARHIVLATGSSGEPNVPSYPGVEQFEGGIVHSSEYGPGGSSMWAGKAAVVVGSANSGHDLCQELYNAGASVTMVQRSPALVMSVDPGIAVLLKPAYSEEGPPIEESDLAVASFPNNASIPYGKMAYGAICHLDHDLRQGLRNSGFLLEEENYGGPLVRYLTRGGGHYVNVGGSELIIDGKVNIKTGKIAQFEQDGIRMEAGTLLEADIVIFATGYKSMRETAKRVFGAKIADRTGPVWGFDGEGELQGLWRPSGHPGFWYMGGYLAMQIKAAEEGLHG